jgi:hypothetical protein
MRGVWPRIARGEEPLDGCDIPEVREQPSFVGREDEDASRSTESCEIEDVGKARHHQGIERPALKRIADGEVTSGQIVANR